jgi:hypothetical protein
MTKKLERSQWLEGFTPLPSNLHPTFFVLRKLLANSFKVKREQEGGATTREESNSIFDDFFEATGPTPEQSSSPKRAGASILLDNYDRAYKNALYYYLHTGDPVVCLSGMIQYTPKEEDFAPLLKMLTKQYIDQLIFECIESGDWLNHFSKLLKFLTEVTNHSKVFNYEKATEYVENQLTKLKNPKFQVSWLLAIGKSNEALKVTEVLSLQVVLAHIDPVFVSIFDQIE